MYDERRYALARELDSLRLDVARIATQVESLSKDKLPQWVFLLLGPTCAVIIAHFMGGR